VFAKARDLCFRFGARTDRREKLHDARVGIHGRERRGILFAPGTQEKALGRDDGVEGNATDLMNSKGP
jgi:hypothetical protein